MFDSLLRSHLPFREALDATQNLSFVANEEEEIGQTSSGRIFKIALHSLLFVN